MRVRRLRALPYEVDVDETLMVSITTFLGEDINKNVQTFRMYDEAKEKITSILQIGTIDKRRTK